MTSGAKIEPRVGSSPIRCQRGDRRCFFLSSWLSPSSRIKTTSTLHGFFIRVLSDTSQRDPREPGCTQAKRRVTEQRQPPQPNTPDLLPNPASESFPAPTRSEAGAAGQERARLCTASLFQESLLLVTANEVQQRRGGRRDVFPFGYQPTVESVPASRRDAEEGAGELCPAQPLIKRDFRSHKLNFQGTSGRSIRRCLPPAINPPAHPKRR